MSGQPAPVRVAVVNDYAIVVAGIAAVLEPFGDRVEVVELDSRLPVVSDVDVVLYDSFGQPQGEAMRLGEIVATDSSRVLVISWNTHPHMVGQALTAGAAGYVAKSITGEGLVEAIERVHRGETVRPAAEDDGDEFGAWPGQDLGLTPREAEVLALICQGLSNQEIAERAYIGANTLKTYIRTLYGKLGVESRVRAVLWGIDHGFRPDRVRLTPSATSFGNGTADGSANGSANGSVDGSGDRPTLRQPPPST
jgi:two-component system, NarL family, response regulator LiaR